MVLKEICGCVISHVFLPSVPESVSSLDGGKGRRRRRRNRNRRRGNGGPASGTETDNSVTSHRDNNNLGDGVPQANSVIGQKEAPLPNRSGGSVQTNQSSAGSAARSQSPPKTTTAAKPNPPAPSSSRNNNTAPKTNGEVISDKDSLAKVSNATIQLKTDPKEAPKGQREPRRTTGRGGARGPPPGMGNNVKNSPLTEGSKSKPAMPKEKMVNGE